MKDFFSALVLFSAAGMIPELLLPESRTKKMLWCLMGLLLLCLMVEKGRAWLSGLEGEIRLLDWKP